MRILISPQSLWSTLGATPCIPAATRAGTSVARDAQGVGKCWLWPLDVLLHKTNAVLHKTGRDMKDGQS